MNRFWRLYDGFMSWVLAILVAAIVLIMFAQVTLRYLFSAPFAWAEETAAYLFVWIVFLGGGPAFVRGVHIAVDYYANFVPRRYHRAVTVVVSIPVLGFLALMMVLGWQFTEINAGVPAYTTNAYTLGQAYFAIPLGCFLMIIGLLRFLLVGPDRGERAPAGQQSGTNIVT